MNRVVSSHFLPKLNVYLAIVFIPIVFGVYPSKGLGQSAEPTALRDYYSTPGLNPFEERINDSFNESISPFNGILQFTNTDVFLPGNGGHGHPSRT